MTSLLEVLFVDLTREALREQAVVATAPRVVVLRVEPERVDELVPHSRLAIVRTADGATESRGDASVVDELDAGARLFVEAWRAPQRAKTERPGDHLPWDAPGFEPPDLPP